MKCDDRVGALKPGRAADFVMLDDELRVTETWIDGERVDAGIAS